MWNEGGSLEGRDPGITVPLLVTKTPFQAHSPELSKEWCMIKMTQTFHHPSGTKDNLGIYVLFCQECCYQGRYVYILLQPPLTIKLHMSKRYTDMNVIFNGMQKIWFCLKGNFLLHVPQLDYSINWSSPPCQWSLSKQTRSQKV